MEARYRDMHRQRLPLPVRQSDDLCAAHQHRGGHWLLVGEVGDLIREARAFPVDEKQVKTFPALDLVLLDFIELCRALARIVQ